MTRPRRLVRNELHPRAREWLLSGFDRDYIAPELGPHGLAGFETEADAREAWLANRDELIGEWLEGEPYQSADGLEMRGGPGTRPWGWWRFDARAPRHVTGADSARQAELRAMGWGTEEAWRTFFGRAWGPHLSVEPELSYLRRHRLLLESEERALDAPSGPRAVE